VALAEVGRFDEAIAQLEAAARRHDSADLRYDLGFVYGKQHHLDDAIRECQTALRLDPEHFGAHGQLGLALLASHRIDEASAPGVGRRRPLARGSVQPGRARGRVRAAAPPPGESPNHSRGRLV